MAFGLQPHHDYPHHHHHHHYIITPGCWQHILWYPRSSYRRYFYSHLSSAQELAFFQLNPGHLPDGIASPQQRHVRPRPSGLRQNTKKPFRSHPTRKILWPKLKHFWTEMQNLPTLSFFWFMSQPWKRRKKQGRIHHLDLIQLRLSTLDTKALSGLPLTNKFA